VIGEVYFKVLREVGSSGQSFESWVDVSFILVVYIRKREKYDSFET
jgi:hypothetical protein